MLRLPPVTNEKELAALVRELGFLPFFRSAIPGFSLEECTPAAYWFADGVDGPWEWKGRVLGGEIAYGRVFQRKMGFVAREWLPDFCNYRRDGYDFEGFYEDGHASYKCKAVMDALESGGPMRTKSLKERCGYRKGGEKGFESVMSLLQMRAFVTVSAFEYELDRHGRPYSWGLARFARMEDVFGEALVSAADATAPLDSAARITARIAALCPGADERAVSRLVRV